MSSADQYDSVPESLAKRCDTLLTKLGIAGPEEVQCAKLLAGGVASDVVVIQLIDRQICVKFASATLRVAADWRVPVDRNRAEYEWLDFVGKAAPGSAPKLFGHVPDLNGFAMEYVQGEDVYLWKSALLARKPSRGEARKAGAVLGKIHAASTRPDFDSSRFQTQANFNKLRLDPYFAHTARFHAGVSASLHQLIASLQEISTVLIHGDVSPKNVLFRENAPVFIDAECATMGDPAFDVAFCLNHLALKSFLMPDWEEALFEEMREFWVGYAEHVDWESPERMERRVWKILPALMLARIDGMSPVEYLNERARAVVREVSIKQLSLPSVSLASLTRAVSAANRGLHCEQN